MLVKIWDKFKIKKNDRRHIAEALRMASDEDINYNDSHAIANGIWIVSGVPKDPIIDLEKSYFWFTNGDHAIGMTLSEVIKLEEKPKPNKKQLKII